MYSDRRQQGPLIRILTFGASVLLASTALTILPAQADTPIKKVVNGLDAVAVDNGWVAIEPVDTVQNALSQPYLAHYNVDPSGDFGTSSTLKLKTPGFSLATGGPVLTVGGLVFAASSKGKSLPSGADAIPGIGVAFGDAIASGGGQGSSNGGWINDDTVTTHLTSGTQFLPATLAALAVSPSNGAFAVGWDTPPAGGTAGLIWQLDASGQTYAPVAKTFLPNLAGGALGALSQAFNISRGAVYVVGLAQDSAQVSHAVYTPVTGSAWIEVNLPANIPTALGGQAIVHSKALAASDAGFVAGSVTVKQAVDGRPDTSVEVGFVVNVTTSNPPTFFAIPGANVIPLQVQDDGTVIGNLEFILPAGTPAGTPHAYHPFLAAGGSVTDFGTLVLPNSAAAYGCRVNGANSAGETVGTCIASSAGTYGASADAAFFLDAAGTTPAFVNLGATLAANAATKSTVKGFAIGTASAIDDEGEITLVGIKLSKGVPTGAHASFLISKNAY